MEPLCQELLEFANIRKGQYSQDERSVVTRLSRLGQAFQQVAPTTLHTALLYHANDPLLANYSGGKRMYDMTKRLRYCLHMLSDVYIYVEKCMDCRKQRRHPTHQRFLKRFHSEGRLEFIALDILGPLSKTKTGNRFVVVITSRFLC